MSSNVQVNKMGYMPENKLLLSMSIPMMLSMLIQALYNIIDGLFVAGISPEQYEYTAVNLAFPAQNLMIAVAVGAGVGINALISRNLGLGNKERANKIAGQGAFIAIVSYFLFAIVGTLLTRPYFNLMTADITDSVERELVVQHGVDYLTICFVCSFGFFCQVACEKFMQSTGKTTLSMTTQLVGAIVNIVLDPILIKGLLFLPELGIKGAACATVIGQMCSALVGVYLQKTRNTEIVIKLDVLLQVANVLWIDIIVILIVGLGLYPLTVALFSRVKLKDYFRAMIKPQIVSFSTASSLATLPVNMNACDEMGVSKQTSGFVLPLGATINMSGNAIYYALLATFFAQFYGIDLTMGDYVSITIVCALGAIGQAGVPGPTLLAAAVLVAAGIPLEGLPLFYALDRIFDMMRTTLNITGDAACAAVVDRFVKR